MFEHGDSIFLDDLEIDCIIGIFPRERVRKQKVLVRYEVPCDAALAAASDNIKDALDYKRIAKSTLRYVQRSRFHLIETLAESLARKMLQENLIEWIRVTVSKPGAVRFSKNVGVTILRRQPQVRGRKSAQRIFLSLGSNVNREQMMPRTLRLLKSTFDVKRVSSVYESMPVGTLSGEPFWNMIVEIVSKEEPLQLKKHLATLERRLGRQKTHDKYAPRTMDIDIIFYNQLITERGLVIPHAESSSAPYVILPMAEIAPHFQHPILKQTMIEIIGSRLDEFGLFKKVSI